MKAALALIVALGASTAMAAIPETTNLTCSEARQIVQRNGVIDMTTNGGRYVRYTSDTNGSFCFSDEHADQVFVETADAKNCPVGFVCVDKDHLGGNSSDND